MKRAAETTQWLESMGEWQPQRVDWQPRQGRDLRADHPRVTRGPYLPEERRLHVRSRAGRHATPGGCCRLHQAPPRRCPSYGPGAVAGKGSPAPRPRP
ncbi:hypothetical protein SGPA1_80057 [Streptomyces misionensis JCM 4497]